MISNLYPLQFLGGMSEYSKKIKEINKQVAIEINSKLDGILESKILAETLGSSSPTLQAISKMTNKPLWFVKLKYEFKKFRYKLV